MGFLDEVQDGLVASGVRAIFSGAEKVGKTTFITSAPDTLLIPLEVGYAGISCKKTPMIQTYDEFSTLLSEIEQQAVDGTLPYRTLAIDSLTQLERYVQQYVLSLDPQTKSGKANTMESAHGGYGKAYHVAVGEMQRLLHRLDALAMYYHINIVFSCHVFSTKVADPTVGEYHMYDLSLHAFKNDKNFSVRELVTQWADVVGFIYEPVSVIGDDKKQHRAVSTGKGRTLGLSRTPAYVAGNRYGIDGEIPLANVASNPWNSFAQAMYDASNQGIDLFTR